MRARAYDAPAQKKSEKTIYKRYRSWYNNNKK